MLARLRLDESNQSVLDMIYHRVRNLIDGGERFTSWVVLEELERLDSSNSALPDALTVCLLWKGSQLSYRTIPKSAKRFFVW